MNNLPIIYENENIYIIHKPSGLATQGGHGIVHSVDTVFANQVGKKVYLVHRLDKDTEGLLIVAKDSESASKWTELIAGKEITKEYYALCIGEFEQKKGIITDSITHKGVTKEALTYFNVEKTFSFTYEENNEEKLLFLSLVRLQLGTGRMHQIRIHLAKRENPIAGDDKYGNFKINKILKKHRKIKKLQLAAIQLSIPAKFIENSMHKNQEKDAASIISIPLPTYIEKNCIE